MSSRRRVIQPVRALWACAPDGRHAANSRTVPPKRITASPASNVVLIWAPVKASEVGDAEPVDPAPPLPVLVSALPVPVPLAPVPVPVPVPPGPEPPAVVGVTGTVVVVGGGAVVVVGGGAVVVVVVGATVVVVVVGGGAEQMGAVMVLVSRVTAAVLASRRPSMVAPVVAVMAVEARIVPMNVEAVPSVAELPTSQKTLQGLAPLMRITLLADAVTRVDAAWNMKTAFGSP